MIVHLSIRVWWNPSCTKTTLIKNHFVYTYEMKDNDRTLRVVV
jgi:hypothetical protein